MTRDDQAGAAHRWWVPALHATLHRGAVFLDLGAGEGSWTLPAVATGAKVLAWEPASATMARLRERVGRSLLGTQVEALQYAASREDGWRPLRPRPGEEERGSASLVSTAEGPTEWACTRRVDRFLEVTPRVDLLRVSVEGEDAPALEGAVELLRRDRPLIIWRDHGHRYPGRATSDRVHNVVQAVGYQGVGLRTETDALGLPRAVYLLYPEEGPEPDGTWQVAAQVGAAEVPTVPWWRTGW
jgi:FkbM family methyltransferase